MTFKKDFCLNEKDSLTDILNNEKALVKLYSTALTETTNKQLRKFIKNKISQTADDEYLVFSDMQKNDYYNVKMATEEALQEKIQCFSKIEKEIANN